MADNTKDDNNEPKENEEEFGEEFDFESDPHSDVLAPEELEGSEEVQEVVEPAKRRSVMLPLIIGVAVIGFIGWKVYGYLSAPKTTQTKGAPKATQLEVTKLEPKAAPTAPTVAADITQPKGAIPNLYEAEQQAKQAVSDEKITAILQKKIDDQFNAQKQQIEAIQKEVASATQNSANANKTTAAVQHDLAMLQTTVQDLVNQIKAINANEAAALAKEQEREAREKERAKPKKPKITSKSESFTSPNLSVHAIIPGRAWIRTPDGKTITVTEGDTVGEYGKVLKIDAANGQVVTTSGVTLR